jgi:spermidine dehydrogenase
VGRYRPDYHPDKPTVLSMYKYLHKPGLPLDEQLKSTRLELEKKPFEDYEREIRSELQHLWGRHGFDAARDILGITINRWGHGYNFFYAPRPDGSPTVPPYVRGRQRHGPISFAGADAGGIPLTQQAILQGWRAAMEQLETT